AALNRGQMQIGFDRVHELTHPPLSSQQISEVDSTVEDMGSRQAPRSQANHQKFLPKLAAPSRCDGPANGGAVSIDQFRPSGRQPFGAANVPFDFTYETSRSSVIHGAGAEVIRSTPCRVLILPIRAANPSEHVSRFHGERRSLVALNGPLRTLPEG